MPFSYGVICVVRRAKLNLTYRLVVFLVEAVCLVIIRLESVVILYFK